MAWQTCTAPSWSRRAGLSIDSVKFCRQALPTCAVMAPAIAILWQLSGYCSECLSTGSVKFCRQVPHQIAVLAPALAKLCSSCRHSETRLSDRAAPSFAGNLHQMCCPGSSCGRHGQKAHFYQRLVVTSSASSLIQGSGDVQAWFHAWPVGCVRRSANGSSWSSRGALTPGWRSAKTPKRAPLYLDNSSLASCATLRAAGRCAPLWQAPHARSDLRQK